MKDARVDSAEHLPDDHPAAALAEPPARWAWAATALGPALAAVAWLACWAGGLPAEQRWVAAVTAWCATWWIAEALPLAVTALVPFVVFPLVGVLDARGVAAALGDTTILLFLGGFLLSRAAEATGTHVRVADAMLRAVGTGSGRRVVAAFMLATAFISMWISNTASALIMLPVATAVLARPGAAPVSAALMLGIAYAASIGGLATPIGTPPNLIFLAQYRQLAGGDVPFLRWMMLGVPLSAVLLIAAFFVVTFGMRAGGAIDLPASATARGRWRTAQRRVLAVFTLAALLWMLRTAPWGGWQAWLNLGGADDATVALGCAVLLFLVPRGGGEAGRLLDWKTAAGLPWGLLLLFAGGLALARGFAESGLSDSIGAALGGLGGLPTIALIVLVALAVTFASEIASNTAIAALLMPILFGVAGAIGRPAGELMLPAALAATCGFMLPIATPPNAVIFSSGRVTVRQMAVRGFWLDVISAPLIALFCWLMLGAVLGGSPTR